MPTPLARLRRRAEDTAAAIADAADSLAKGATDGRDSVVTTVGEGVAGAAATAADAAGTAATATTDAVAGLVDRLADVVEAIGGKVGDAAAEVERSGRSTAGAARGASKELEATVKDAAARVRDGAPLDDVVRRLERRWPGTDEERYDRAFQRGYARGRSGRLAVGLAIGAMAAAAGTWLLDPERGAGRRARVAAQGRLLVERGRRELEARGITVPGGASSPAEPKLLPATASPDAIGEIPSQREGPGMTADPLTPVAAGTVAAEGHDTTTTGSGS